MHSVLIKLGPLSIYSYGVMVALGFGLSTFLIYTRAAKFNLDKERIIDLAIIILVGGIIGARLLYVLSNVDYYASRPIEILNLSKGGLVWYGGFVAGLIVSIWYLKKNRINFWAFTDLAAPYIALAQSLGRIGCFLNGCCFGIEGHPVQIYSSLALLAIFAILRAWQDRRHFAGEIFLGYCLLYSLKRFFMEFLRGDNPVVALNLTVSQIISALVFFISIFIFIYRAFRWKAAR